MKELEKHLLLPVTLNQLKSLYMWLENSTTELGSELEAVQDAIRELLFQNVSVGDFENLQNESAQDL